MTDSYKPEFWYWEVVELVRKLVLTGVFVVVLHGSLAQLAMATLVMAAFTLAVAYLEPYAEKHPGDRVGAIAVFTHAQLFAVFFMSLVLKAVANAGTDGKHAANNFAVGLDNGMLGGLLIFTCVSTLIMLGYSVYTDDLRHYRRAKALHSQNGREGGALPGAGPDASSGDMSTRRKPKPAQAKVIV